MKGNGKRKEKVRKVQEAKVTNRASYSTLNALKTKKEKGKITNRNCNHNIRFLYSLLTCSEQSPLTHFLYLT